MSKLSLIASVEDLTKPQWCDFEPANEEDDPEKVEMLISPWTRTTQAIVEKKSKSRKIERSEELADIPDGSGVAKSERFLIELADHLLRDWKNVVDQVDGVTALECNLRNKMFFFESLDNAVWIVNKAKSIGALVVKEDAKN